MACHNLCNLLVLVMQLSILIIFLFILHEQADYY